ncbi:MAG: hypothetical protein WBE14_28355 [Xanthobacteraceae bacterium]
MIAIGAKKNRADRPRQKRNAERAERDQERHRFVGRREEHLGDDDGEIAVDQDFVEFERIADGSRDDEPGCGAGAVRAVVSLKCRRAHRACSVLRPSAAASVWRTFVAGIAALQRKSPSRAPRL